MSQRGNNVCEFSEVYFNLIFTVTDLDIFPFFNHIKYGWYNRFMKFDNSCDLLTSESKYCSVNRSRQRFLREKLHDDAASSLFQVTKQRKKQHQNTRKQNIQIQDHNTLPKFVF